MNSSHEQPTDNYILQHNAAKIMMLEGGLATLGGLAIGSVETILGSVAALAEVPADTYWRHALIGVGFAVFGYANTRLAQPFDQWITRLQRSNTV